MPMSRTWDRLLVMTPPQTQHMKWQAVLLAKCRIYFGFSLQLGGKIEGTFCFKETESFSSNLDLPHLCIVAFLRSENEAKTRNATYEGQDYNGSQWPAIGEYLRKIMSVNYRITPNSGAGRGDMTLGGAAKWYQLQEVLNSSVNPWFHTADGIHNLELTMDYPRKVVNVVLECQAGRVMFSHLICHRNKQTTS